MHRLGVGASIPMMLPLAHEASKLKRRLGKNGAKSEGLVESQSLDSSKSDDEERKGRPSKRKAKVDPFGHEGSKKRKAHSEANPFVTNRPRHSVSPLNSTTSGGPIMHSQGHPFCPSTQCIIEPYQIHSPERKGERDRVING